MSQPQHLRRFPAGVMMEGVSEPFTAPRSGWYAYGISATDHSGEPASVQSITLDSVPGGFEVTAGGVRELSFTCPRCGMTSYNANDIREGYCGNCHDWTGKPR